MRYLPERLFSAKALHTLWNRTAMARFFSVNRNIFLRTLCLVTVPLFFTSAGAAQGEVILAVNTLLMQLFTLYSYIMDGFAFAGEALRGRCEIVQAAGAELVGIGCAVEKGFQGGGDKLRAAGVNLHSLAIIESAEPGNIVFREEEA